MCLASLLQRPWDCPEEGPIREAGRKRRDTVRRTIAQEALPSSRQLTAVLPVSFKKNIPFAGGGLSEEIRIKCVSVYRFSGADEFLVALQLLVSRRPAAAS